MHSCTWWNGVLIWFICGREQLFICPLHTHTYTHLHRLFQQPTLLARDWSGPPHRRLLPSPPATLVCHCPRTYHLYVCTSCDMCVHLWASAEIQSSGVHILLHDVRVRAASSLAAASCNGILWLISTSMSFQDESMWFPILYTYIEFPAVESAS